MNIAIDVGNTRTKVSLHDGSRMVYFNSFAKSLPKELEKDVLSLQPKRGIVSTVSRNEHELQFLFPEVEWLKFNHELNFPFKSQYNSPETLGLDRLALATAMAISFPKQNVLAIDAGTCVTYDLMSQDASYMGGAISPGLSMRFKSMNKFTAKLPLASKNSNANLIGKSTVECLQTGGLFGLASEIDGMITRYKEQFASLQIVLTGGDAKVLVPLIKNNIFARPKFLLEGLHAVLAYNTN